MAVLLFRIVPDYMKFVIAFCLPPEGKCKIKSIIYKAELIEDNCKRNYIGVTESEFKIRYRNHKNSFINEKRKNDTSLSKEVWKKKLNPEPNIRWSILKKGKPYRPGDRLCSLCNWEKVFILNASKDSNNLNKRTEINSKCVHKKKHTLAYA